MSMRLWKNSFAFLLCASLLAQQAPVTPPEQDVTQGKIVTFTYRVVAATTVYDKRTNNYLTDLRASDFQLFDNDKPQTASVDMAYYPISMVVAIQANSDVEGMLPNIRRMGSLLSNLVLGEQGEAAILAFDHRIRRVQDFTNDPEKFRTALEKINAGSSTSVLIDAMTEATRMLKQRRERRKIILLVSETRDRGSETRLREALTGAEFQEIIVYTLNMNRAANLFTKSNPAPAPAQMPAPAAMGSPIGGLQTPNTVMQNRGSGTNFAPLFEEFFRGVQGIFSDNPSEVFTKYTGGREFSFATQKGVEQALEQLGTELHSQYLISYTPTNVDEGGYHHIRVVVQKPNVEVRTRPGYWLAGTATK